MSYGAPQVRLPCSTLYIISLVRILVCIGHSSRFLRSGYLQALCSAYLLQEFALGLFWANPFCITNREAWMSSQMVYILMLKYNLCIQDTRYSRMHTPPCPEYRINGIGRSLEWPPPLTQTSHLTREVSGDGWDVCIICIWDENSTNYQPHRMHVSSIVESTRSETPHSITSLLC